VAIEKVGGRLIAYWVSHGVPGEDDYGCSIISSSAAERWKMSQFDHEFPASGRVPEVAGPQAYSVLRVRAWCTRVSRSPERRSLVPEK